MNHLKKWCWNNEKTQVRIREENYSWDRTNSLCKYRDKNNWADSNSVENNHKLNNKSACCNTGRVCVSDSYFPLWFCRKTLKQCVAVSQLGDVITNKGTVPSQAAFGSSWIFKNCCSVSVWRQGGKKSRSNVKLTYSLLARFSSSHSQGERW